MKLRKIDGKDKYYVPGILLHCFQMHEISEKDLHMAMTVEDYEKLADHVHKTDKQNNTV